MVTKVQSLFCYNLKKYRKQARLSQETLAEMANITPKHLSAIEIGRRFPSPEAFQRLADALSMEPFRFFLDDRSTLSNLDEATLVKFQAHLIAAFPAFVSDNAKTIAAKE